MIELFIIHGVGYMCEWCRYKENFTRFNIAPRMDRSQNKIKKPTEKEEQKLVVLWLLCVIFLDRVLSLFAVTFQVHHSPPSTFNDKKVDKEILTWEGINVAQ